MFALLHFDVFPFETKKCRMYMFCWKMWFITTRTRSKIFLFTMYSEMKGSSCVGRNMTHFPGFRRGNLRPALRIFFVSSRVENAVGNVKWKLKNWKRGSELEHGSLCFIGSLAITFAAATISFYASTLFKTLYPFVQPL